MKFPVEETVQRWADFDILGKVKYLLDRVKELNTDMKGLSPTTIKTVQNRQNILEDALNALEERMRVHLEAHQALMDKPEVGK